jgi:hypothetical protein
MTRMALFPKKVGTNSFGIHVRPTEDEIGDTYSTSDCSDIQGYKWQYTRQWTGWKYNGSSRSAFTAYFTTATVGTIAVICAVYMSGNKYLQATPNVVAKHATSDYYFLQRQNTSQYLTQVPIFIGVDRVAFIDYYGGGSCYIAMSQPLFELRPI